MVSDAFFGFGNAEVRYVFARKGKKNQIAIREEEISGSPGALVLTLLDRIALFPPVR